MFTETRTESAYVYAHELTEILNAPSPMRRSPLQGFAVGAGVGVNVFVGVGGTAVAVRVTVGGGAKVAAGAVGVSAWAISTVWVGAGRVGVGVGNSVTHPAVRSITNSIDAASSRTGVCWLILPSLFFSRSRCKTRNVYLNYHSDHRFIKRRRILFASCTGDSSLKRRFRQHSFGYKALSTEKTGTSTWRIHLDSHGALAVRGQKRPQGDRLMRLRVKTGCDSKVQANGLKPAISCILS